MHLREFLFRENMKVLEFAKLIPCNRCALSGIINGKRKPGPKIIRRILDLTQGKVTEKDLLDISKRKNK